MYVLTCSDYDPIAGTCAQEQWTNETAWGLPPLSPSEGATLGASVLVLFAVAWLLKRLRKTIETL